MNRTIALLLTTLACAPPSPDFEVPEPTDYSYALLDAVRVSSEDCGYEVVSDNALTRTTGLLTLQSRFETVTMDLINVFPDCTEEAIGPIGPGEEVANVTGWGNVVRVLTPEGEVHSAWMLLFQEGGVVLQ